MARHRGLDGGRAPQIPKLGMSSGLVTPQVGSRKKVRTEESHDETKLCPNMN